MKANDLGITAFAVEMMNAVCPIGSEVIFLAANGKRDMTTTRSEASVTPTGLAIIEVYGVDGYVSLSRILIPAATIEKARKLTKGEPCKS